MSSTSVSPHDSSLVIRPAILSDAAALTRMIRELAEYERLASEVVATEEELRQSLFGASPVAEAVLSLWEGEPAGFAIYFQNYSTFLGRAGLYLEDLYVCPAHRGRGIGKRMLRHLARLAVARRAGRLEWSVLDWNAPAIAFYESLGAERLRGWSVYRLSGERLQRLSQGE